MNIIDFERTSGTTLGVVPLRFRGRSGEGRGRVGMLGEEGSRGGYGEEKRNRVKMKTGRRK